MNGANTADAGKMMGETHESRSIQRALEGRHLGGKYMTFKLADEEYGLEILMVRDVIGLMEITRVPRTREFIRGVINLRGKVIPVVDVRLKFGMPETELTEQTVIIVVQFNVGDRALTMGILVDEVLEVLDIPNERIEAAPDFGVASLDTDFILGVGKVEERVIFLVDIGRVLTTGEVQSVINGLELSSSDTRHDPLS